MATYVCRGADCLSHSAALTLISAQSCVEGWIFFDFFFFLWQCLHRCQQELTAHIMRRLAACKSTWYCKDKTRSQAVGWKWPAHCLPRVWIQKSALNKRLSSQTEMTWPHSADARPRIYPQTRNLTRKTRMDHLPPHHLRLLTISRVRLKHVGFVLTVDLRGCAGLAWWLARAFFLFSSPLPLSLTQGNTVAEPSTRNHEQTRCQGDVIRHWGLKARPLAEIKVLLSRTGRGHSLPDWLFNQA